MSEIHKPGDENDVSHMIRQVAAAEVPMEIMGSGSKHNIGRPSQTALIMSTENLRGVTLYEPTELVIAAMAGTPLATIETELTKHNQQLAFEPIDLGNAVGSGGGTATIGGIIAANLSGSRRIYAGAARDHLLGIRAVNGRGEIFKSGGRVMKNVTGYDLCKTMAGSWGTLSVLTEITMKVLPKPEETRTLVIRGLTDEMANEVLCAAMTTPYEVSGAVHLHQDMTARLRLTALDGIDSAITALRIENISSSVDYRMTQLQKRFAAYGEIVELDNGASLAFWNKLQGLAFLEDGDAPVWRISTAPKAGHRV
ncbi:MAG: FAD-binding protein, partial [Methyloligellaceae bacterium]